jgi:hypothetical protein
MDELDNPGLDEPARNSEPVQSPKKLDISRTLSGSLLNKMKILRDAIDEIDGLIQLRKALSDSIYERVDREISDADFQLSQLKPWQLGHNHSIEMRRIGVEREILALMKEKRSEDVKKWEHISSLLKVRRQFVIELEHLQTTRQTLEESAP